MTTVNAVDKESRKPSKAKVIKPKAKKAKPKAKAKANGHAEPTKADPKLVAAIKKAAQEEPAAVIVRRYAQTKIDRDAFLAAAVAAGLNRAHCASVLRVTRSK